MRLSLSLTLLIWALQSAPAAALQLYRTPADPQPLPEDRAKGCAELEQEITALLPLTYSYKPNFYQDPYQGGAIFLGTVVHPGFYAPLLYSAGFDYYENHRTIPADDRLEQLRRLKAEKHCYER